MTRSNSVFLDEGWLLKRDDDLKYPSTHASNENSELKTQHTVLVIDDAKDMRTLVEHILTRSGYSVVCESDGESGLAAIRRLRPDLVICDWLMPGLNGPELVQRVRADSTVAGTPIVLLTAKSDQESRYSAQAGGADAFLGKPFNHAELVSVVRNLLRLKQGEKEIGRLNSHLEWIFSSLSEAVFVVDQHFRIEKLNDAAVRLTGFEQDALLGTAFDGLLADDEILKSVGLANLFVKGDFAGLTVRVRHASGEVISVTCGGAREKNGHEAGAVLSITDTRALQDLLRLQGSSLKKERELSGELREAYSELESRREAENKHHKSLLAQAEKLSMLGQMAATVGHEINNPVFVAKMTTDELKAHIRDLEYTLAELFDDSPEAQAVWELFQKNFVSLREGLANLSVAVNRLEDVSVALRTQTRMDLEMDPEVNLNNVIRECITLARGKLKASQLEEVLGDLPLVPGFRSKLGQVITNLLANAGDAVEEERELRKADDSPYTGRIRIASEIQMREGRHGVAVVVADSGAGVPDELKKKIFEQFFTTKAAGVGTGLGLSLCVDLVKEHHGYLEVRDSSEFGGAEFTLWIPVKEPAPA